MLESGNDACVAIAEHLAGSEEDFSELQNRKAKAIGAWDTHFVNPHGLSDPKHYTTAYDLGTMARYSLRNSKFQKIVRSQEKIPERLGETRSFLVPTVYCGATVVVTGSKPALRKRRGSAW